MRRVKSRKKNVKFRFTSHTQIIVILALLCGAPLVLYGSVKLMVFAGKVLSEALKEKVQKN